MYGKKVKLRALFLISILALLILITYLFLKSLEENVVYFASKDFLTSGGIYFSSCLANILFAFK